MGRVDVFSYLASRVPLKWVANAAKSAKEKTSEWLKVIPLMPKLVLGVK